MTPNLTVPHLLFVLGFIIIALVIFALWDWHAARVQQVRDEGVKRGHLAGWSEGHAAGVAEGYGIGKTKGEQSGFGEGHDAGRAATDKAMLARYADSYKTGYSAGCTTHNEAMAARYADGVRHGYDEGKSEGYAAGYRDGNRRLLQPKDGKTGRFVKA